MIRLLIADDERMEREALADIVMRRFEHEVTVEMAENGRKAADTAVLWEADLILMDIEMPGMNGLDAARAVLEQRPECKVIFITAYSLFQYAHEAVHLGACDYLLKPVDPDETEAAIRRAIRQIEAGRRLAELAAEAPEPETAPEQETEPAGEGESDRNALVMDHVRKYMEDNYMADLSLDSVSEILHISPAYLSAQFKKYQKMNFLDCLTELRINAAKELLADPFRSAAEVASMVAENGRKAADTAVLWEADLILMDIEMPGMNGLDAARAVLEQRPECKVIFITAYSLFQYAHEAVHLGACDYLLKPVDPDETEAAIRRAIRQIEAGRRLAELAAEAPEPETAPEQETEPAGEGESDRNALVMDHVRKYMEDNYMADLSLDSVSEILHISPAYLSAQFKKYQKMNFLDCLTELRINAAKELLADPFRSAAEVASMVGYEDASYFARAFKKRTGMTPTQYRKEAAKAAREARL